MTKCHDNCSCITCKPIYCTNVSAIGHSIVSLTGTPVTATAEASECSYIGWVDSWYRSLYTAQQRATSLAENNASVINQTLEIIFNTPGTTSTYQMAISTYDNGGNPIYTTITNSFLTAFHV